MPANLHVAGTIDLASAVQFLPSLAKAAPISTQQGSSPTSAQGSATPPEAKDPPERLTASGQLELDLNLGGTLKSIVPRGSLKLQNASLSGPPLPAPVQALTMEATIDNGMVQLQQLAAQVAGGEIRASGSLPLSLLPKSLRIAAPPSDQPAAFTASVSGLNLGQMLGVGDTVTGTVSLLLEAHAPRLEVSAIDAELRVDELNLRVGTIPVGQRGKSLIAVRGGEALLEQVIITGPDTQLVLAGTAGVTAPYNLDLVVRGKTNAALASAFAQDLKAQGATDLQVTVAGTAAEPQMQGFVVLQGGQFSLSTPQAAGRRRAPDVAPCAILG